MAKGQKFKGIVGNIAAQKKNEKDSIKNNIIIRDELKSYIPPLTSEEYARLEQNIITEGCRDALIVWPNKDKYILVDGHNRHSICTKHNIDFKIEAKDFTNIDEVKDWMITNQLGKRNLTEVAKSYLRGKQYNREKKKIGGSGSNQYTSNVDKMSTQRRTNEKLAEVHKVSPKTIERDEKYAADIDKFTGKDHSLKWKLLNKDIDIPKSTLSSLIKQGEDTIKKIRTELKKGTGLSEAMADTSPKKEVKPTSEIQEFQSQISKTIKNAISNQDKKLIDEAIALLKKLRDKM